jgi:hypothetical protein
MKSRLLKVKLGIAARKSHIMPNYIEIIGLRKIESHPMPDQALKHHENKALLRMIENKFSVFFLSAHLRFDFDIS